MNWKRLDKEKPEIGRMLLLFGKDIEFGNKDCFAIGSRDKVYDILADHCPTPDVTHWLYLENPCENAEPEPKVQDLKWANGWGSKTPEIVLICRKLEHKVSDISDKAFGHVHTIRCNQCGYFYHYDSS